MSKLSTKQQHELDVLDYWTPSNCLYLPTTEADVKRFFDYSDRGIGKQAVMDDVAAEVQRNVGKSTPYSGLARLFYAKRNRDLQITSYLEDWGDTLNAWSFADMPDVVVRDIAKRMRKPGILTCVF